MKSQMIETIKKNIEEFDKEFGQFNVGSGKSPRIMTEDNFKHFLLTSHLSIIDNIIGLVARDCSGYIERDGEKKWQLDMESLEKDLQAIKVGITSLIK